MTLSCRCCLESITSNHCIQLLSVLVAILIMPTMDLFQVDSYHLLVSCFYRKNMVIFCKYEVRPIHQPKNDIKLVLWIIMIIDELLVLVWFIVYNATFNNISAISWRGGRGETVMDWI